MSQERDARSGAGSDVWPSLPLTEWQDTRDTLHAWSQIVGKVALARAPMINQWWQTALQVTARGLTTLPLPHHHRVFQLAFDFTDHQLRVDITDGQTRALPLAPVSVADFYQRTMEVLTGLGLETRIWTTPVEVETPIPFEENRQHTSYHADQAHRFWQILVQTDRVFRAFRSRFNGKVSPSQFFWGSFDLALTRFSGRQAPPYAGGALNVGRWVMEEAYAEEVSSLGFWPGGGGVPYPAFYSYAVPEPPGFREASVRPAGAFYSQEMGEFILSYDVVRSAKDPDATLLAFAQSTYEAAADLAHWDRARLERDPSPRNPA